MGDVDLHALRPMVNRSAAITERRRRILEEARDLIAEKGVEQLNIRDLAARSGVVQRTIYNAFGSKENIIIIAVEQYFSEFFSITEYEHDISTIDGAIERIVTATLRNRENLNYLRAVVLVYFSLTAEPAFRNLLIDIGRKMVVPALRQLEARRQLEKGVDIDLVSVDLSNLRAAILHEWSVGLITEEAFIFRTIEAMLTMLAGIARGAALADIRAWLIDFRERGPRSSACIRAARTRLDEARRSKTAKPRASVARPR